MTYREFVEAAKTHARNVGRGFKHPDDDWEPAFLAELEGGRRAVGFLPNEAFGSDAGKDALIDVALPAIIRRFRARKLAVITSAWVANVEPDDPTDADEYDAAYARGEIVPPSQRPDRVEAVVISVYDAERLEVHVAPILRSRRRPPKLGEWDDRFGLPDQAGGRFPRLQEAFR